MSTQTFLLPDVGEGLTEAEIVSWRVAPGDTVAVNDVLVEIETAKSLVELPSPFAGTVGELLVAEGDTVNVGAAIITIASSVAAPAGPATVGQSEHGEPAESPSDGEGAVLVGYGTGGHVQSRRRKPVGHRAASGSRHPSASSRSRRSASSPATSASTSPTSCPSGAAGEVTRDDVLKHASQASVFRNIETPDWGDVREETIAVAGSGAAAGSGAERRRGTRGDHRRAGRPQGRRVGHGAERVLGSARLGVDRRRRIRTMELVRRLKASPDFADIKVSPLLIMARAVIWAARRTPMVNAAWVDGDDGAQIKVRRYVNLGIAAATPRGLLVPNIKDAQDLKMRDLARALEKLTLTAREGKTTPADQHGGTITITNIGVFGMDAGTPIINPGEAGIVALGTIRQKPWVVDGEVRPRWVTTVAGSFDHRVVDGDGMSRFIADVASILEEPALLLD